MRCFDSGLTESNLYLTSNIKDSIYNVSYCKTPRKFTADAFFKPRQLIFRQLIFVATALCLQAILTSFPLPPVMDLEYSKGR